MVISSVANCAKFYALPKIHKPTLASRPIVPNVSTSSYKLSHFLSQFLAHFTCNNLCTVKNSYDFVDKLKLISLLNYTLLSLDAKSVLLVFEFKGRWFAWKRFYVNSITLLLKLRKFLI